MKWIFAGNQIAMTLDGTIVSITKEDSNFEKVLDALKNKEFGKIPKLLNPVRGVKGIAVKNGVPFFNGRALDGRLAGRIIQMHKERQNFGYLTRFLDRLEKNPSEESRKDLYDFLDANEIQITADGNFLAYKVVTDDLKDVRTRTFDNSVTGKPVKMDRSAVNSDRTQTCSSGLHVCGFGYIKEYGGSKVVQVKVDPANVVSVPTDYNAQKMRVCEYLVVKVLGDYDDVKTAGPIKGTVATMTRQELLTALLDPRGKNRAKLIKMATKRLQKMYDKTVSVTA